MIAFPIQVLLFACVGVAMEVVFTALSDLPKTRSPRLMGWSYIWMLPIYALAPIFLSILQPYVGAAPFLARLLLYVVLLYVVEYLTGFILRKVTGACPWDYTGKRWSVDGLIRLDYLPAWALVCAIFERLFILLNKAPLS